MEPIEIPFNQRKLSVYSIVCFIMAALLILAIVGIINEETASLGRMLIIPCAIGALLFIFYTINCFLKLLTFSPGLIITDNGLINNTSLIKWGLVEWNDIYDIVSWKEWYRVRITLKTDEHEKYVAKASPIMKQFILHNDDGWFMLESPIISTRFLKGDSSKILALITNTWLKNSKEAK